MHDGETTNFIIFCKENLGRILPPCLAALLCVSERQFCSNHSQTCSTLIFCSCLAWGLLSMTKGKTITFEFHCLENFYCVHIRSIYSDEADRLSTDKKRYVSPRPCLGCEAILGFINWLGYLIPHSGMPFGFILLFFPKEFLVSCYYEKN